MEREQRGARAAGKAVGALAVDVRTEEQSGHSPRSRTVTAKVIIIREIGGNISEIKLRELLACAQPDVLSFS